MSEAETLTIPYGLINMHVHLREPGAIHKETFETGTKAAIAGGIVVAYDMPNNYPDKFIPRTHSSMVYKRALARGQAYTDLGFYYRYQPNFNNEGTFPHVARLASGLKTYLEISTGQSEAEAPRDCQPGWQRWHEVASPNQPIIPHVEDESVEEAIAVAAEIGHPIHIPHVNNRFVLETIMKSRQKYPDVQITCEVAPHHLTMTQDDVAQLGWYARMKPWLGTQDDQDFLWYHKEAWQVIADDHAPHTKAEKDRANAENPEGDPTHAVTSFGVPGLDALLPLMLQAVKDKKLTYEELWDKTIYNPAKILGYPLDDSSQVVVSMEEYEFSEADVRSKCGWSPYAMLGKRVTGRVVQVDLHGDTVYRDGVFLNDEGTGEILLAA